MIKDSASIIKSYWMAVLLLSMFCSLKGFAQTSITERLNYVLETQDMELGIKLYNEITLSDLAQLPDTIQFNYHYLGGYLNSSSFAYDCYNKVMLNSTKAINHLMEAKRLCDTSLGTYSGSYMEIIHGLGEEYMELGKYNDALAFFQEGIVKSMAVSNKYKKAFSNLLLGTSDCLELLGWYNEIPNLLMDAWEFWPKDERPLDPINYYPLWNLHQFYRNYEMYSDALKASDRILEYITEFESSNHWTMADELYMRGNTLDKMGRSRDAVECYSSALKILRHNSMENEQLYGMTAGNLLLAMISSQMYNKCYDILEEIKRYGVNVNDKDIYKNSLFTAANALNNLGNYTEALKINSMLQNTELSELERISIEDQTQTINFNKETVESLPQLEELYQSMSCGSSEWFDTSHKLACSYFLIKNLDQFSNVLKKMYAAISDNPVIGNEYGFFVLNNLYGLCREREEYDDILKYANEKFALISAMDNITQDYMYYALKDVILAKLKSKSIDDIFDDIEQATKLCVSLFGIESEEYAILLHNKGRVYQMDGKLKDAKQEYLSSIALHKKIKVVPLINTVRYLKEIEQELNDI